MWLVVNKEREQKTWRIMRALNMGAGNKARITTEPPPRGEPFVVWSYLFGNDELILRAIDDGTPFWYVDNGYMDPARGRGQGYYSLTFRGIHPHWSIKPETSRIGYPFEGWRKRRDGYILVGLPGEGYGRFLGMDMPAWSKDIPDRIATVTGRSQMIRPKRSETPLGKHLDGAFVTVTHSSKVAVDSILKGVPVVCEGTCPAAPVARTSLADIEDPIYPDRRAWFDCLMEQQFTLQEMTSGLAWHFMSKTAREASG